MMTTPDLKPCPFCGSRQIYKKTTVKNAVIWCNLCGAEVSRGMPLGKCDSLAEAEEEFGCKTVEAWNRRANDDAV